MPGAVSPPSRFPIGWVLCALAANSGRRSGILPVRRRPTSVLAPSRASSVLSAVLDGETLGAISLKYAIPGCYFLCSKNQHTALTLICPAIESPGSSFPRKRESAFSMSNGHQTNCTSGNTKADPSFRWDDLTAEYSLSGRLLCLENRNAQLALICPAIESHPRARREGPTGARQGRRASPIGQKVQPAIPERSRRDLLHSEICTGRFRRKRFSPFCRHEGN